MIGLDLFVSMWWSHLNAALPPLVLVADGSFPIRASMNLPRTCQSHLHDMADDVPSKVW